MKISLLGYEYNLEVIEEGHKEFDGMLKNKHEALINYNSRYIYIMKNYYNQDGSIEQEKSKVSLYEDLAHELAHGFMYHSGNDDLNDERHAELLAHFMIASRDINICKDNKNHIISDLIKSDQKKEFKKKKELEKVKYIKSVLGEDYLKKQLDDLDLKEISDKLNEEISKVSLQSQKAEVNMGTLFYGEKLEILFGIRNNLREFNRAKNNGENNDN